MKKIKRTFFIDEKGLTLVEVLASIVILSIILVIFLSIFIQTAKTNKTSEEIIDATYIAQTEMEKFYGYSLSVKESNRVSDLQGEGYTYETSGDEEIYKTINEGYQVEITIKKEGELTNILVQVYDDEDASKPKAQMQNVLEWRDDDEE